MPRPEKVQAVEDIKTQITEAEAAFLTEYRGLSVPQQQELRRGLRAAQAEYKVLKMSLARRAVQDLGFDELEEWLYGPTAIAFAKGDPVLTAKALRDFAKDNEQLILKVGLMAGQVIPPEQVAVLADIEPRDVLLAKLIGAVQAPLSNLAGAMAALARSAAWLFAQLVDEKEEPEPGGEAQVQKQEPEPGGEAQVEEQEPEPGGEARVDEAEEGSAGEADAAGEETEAEDHHEGKGQESEGDHPDPAEEPGSPKPAEQEE